ncbi:MAG: cupin domain-containing protein [Rhizobiaceae bacterium]|nr:cupin domain-containing protein [Rhizobiaceae bacterium]
MSETLGTLEELPQEYRDEMTKAGVAPLWPMMRNVLPHDKPDAVSKSHLWKYDTVRPLLMQAGELTPVEKAERRVLVLSDPGRGNGAMQATASLYAGLQLLLPGETAPAHKHTPSAARIIVEGKGAYTVVEGEKLPMSEGDLILTPGGTWHDHGHEGDEAVVWLDVLDLPLFYYLEGSYAVEAEIQAQRNRPDASQVEYRAAGIVPARRRQNVISKFPMMRFPWDRTKAALQELAAYGGGDAVEVDFVNPETGESPLPVMGFTALMIRPGETVKPPLRSSSAVFHIISGSGRTVMNGEVMDWNAKDTFSVPVFAKMEHSAGDEPAFLIYAHDIPLQEKLGYYEERTR